MPPDHGFWFDDNDGVQAARPNSIEQDPEGPLQSGQPHLGSLVASKDVQLMTKSDDLEL